MEIIREMSRPRERIRGRGVDRKQMPVFALLGVVPSEMVDEILQVCESRRGQDDIIENPSYYSATEGCRVNQLRSRSYRQILFQEPVSHESRFSEDGYSKWNRFKELKIADWIRERFPSCTRTRIAILPPGAEIDWHIDTNTSVACRVHIPILNHEVPLEIKKRNSFYLSAWKRGECWFANTGWPHRVRNVSEIERINLIFTCSSEDVLKNLNELSLSRR